MQEFDPQHSEAAAGPAEFSGFGLSHEIPDPSPTLDALEDFAQMVDELYDAPRPKLAAWEGNTSKLAIRSVRRVLSKWRHAGSRDGPPNALIVRLSRRLPSVLANVCERPRRILQRRRAMEPLHRLRELDSNCVRWLTRQPGRSIAEKAGHRRAVLAVQRFESVDTLENRVVADLLRRCIALARDYLRQHQPHYPSHPWVQGVEGFLKFCRRLSSLPQLAEVSRLASLPKPNYVLMHESRYHEIWRAYLEVIRHQLRRRQLWTWRHRAFSEMTLTALLHSLSHQIGRSSERRKATRAELCLRQNPLRGQFFDWTSPPPQWEIGPEQVVFVGPADVFKQWRAAEHRNAMNVEDSSVYAAVQNGRSCKILRLNARLPEDRTAWQSLNSTADFDLQDACPFAELIVEDIAEAGSPSTPKFMSLEMPVAAVKHPDCLNKLVVEWGKA